MKYIFFLSVDFDVMEKLWSLVWVYVLLFIFGVPITLWQLTFSQLLPKMSTWLLPFGELIVNFILSLETWSKFKKNEQVYSLNL